MELSDLLAADVEVMRNYFMVGLTRGSDRAYKPYELSREHYFEPVDLKRALREHFVVTFNGLGYDQLMIFAAIQGFKNDELKQLNDYIMSRDETGNRRKHWDIIREWDIEIPEWWVDHHIDLMEVSPGATGSVGLKKFGARIHSKTIQDFPVDFDKNLTWGERRQMIPYNRNDNNITLDLAAKLMEEITIRQEWGERLGVSLLAKSDAQVAEAYYRVEYKKRTGEKLQRDKKFKAQPFYYEAPEWMEFETEHMQELFELVQSLKITIGAKSGKAELPQKLADYKVKIGNMRYTMQLGGLHSTECAQAWFADDDYVIMDCDAASFYPRIQLNENYYPEQFGPIFIPIFEVVVDERLRAKAEGNKKLASFLKIVINGTFGKTSSPWSFLYDPWCTIHTTVTGQLSLFMLIEQFELNGIQVISANTDGVVSRIPRKKLAKYHEIVRWFERKAGHAMEFTAYKFLASESVNSYVAAKVNYNPHTMTFGDEIVEVKGKGRFAPSGLAKDPESDICTKAVKELLVNGTPLDTTIYSCTDIRDFIMMTKVDGDGAMKPTKYDFNERASRAEKREALIARGWKRTGTNAKDEKWFKPGRDEYDEQSLDTAYKNSCRPTQAVWLGKVVRWYLSTATRTPILKVKSGHVVPESQNGMPCMTLPDEFPSDVDFDAYAKKARDLMGRIGCAHLIEDL